MSPSPIEKPSEAPFQDPLEPAGFDAEKPEKLKTLKSAPGKIVREQFLYEDPDSHRETIARHRQAKDFFENLQTRYGLKVPAMDLVVGKNESGKPAIFTVVDKIEGRNLADIEELPPEATKKLDAFYAGLIQHHIDAKNENGLLWDDFMNEQIVYGRRQGEQEDNAYIVDVDPHMRTYREAIDGGESFFADFPWIHNQIVQVEEKFYPSVRLARARKKLRDYIFSIDETKEPEPDQKTIRDFKAFLLQEPQT